MVGETEKTVTRANEVIQTGENIIISIKNVLRIRKLRQVSGDEIRESVQYIMLELGLGLEVA